jgi:hypothetical protein
MRCAALHASVCRSVSDRHDADHQQASHALHPDEITKDSACLPAIVSVTATLLDDSRPSTTTSESDDPSTHTDPTVLFPQALEFDRRCRRAVVVNCVEPRNGSLFKGVLLRT